MLRCCFFLIAFCGLAVIADENPKLVHVIIETENRNIEVELNGDKLPATVANFLRYVDGKFDDGGIFHRTVTTTDQRDNKVKIEVIQAGINPKKTLDEFPPLELERTPTPS